jgi:hypothetical protein
LDAIDRADNGMLKNASDAGTQMIRRRLRENGFSRAILPYKQVSDSDFAYLPDTELPVIVEEMEPDSPGAKAIPFNDTADTAFYRGNKFVVYFCKITTPEFTKNVDELRTYKNDLRQIVTDNALKDIQTEEDGRFIKEVDRICAADEAGVVQDYTIPGLITRDTYTECLSFLEDRMLNNGVFLMNRRTAKDILRLDRTEIGGDLAETLFKSGLSGLQSAELGGVRHIYTQKRDLVPDGVMYQFTEPNFLGRAYVMQDVTMYVEKKKDILRFSAQEKIGITFANVAGLNKVTFSGTRSTATV